ncbi:MAG: ATP-dependent sacrificial sulfur transferase LarE, partial [bacterium]|nr:ATP-dependent sacrificial sulfur transferase LarE [bacterium]
MNEIEKKFNQLKEILKDMGSALIAYSGGVDSTFLLKVATDTLGREKVLGVTAQSSTYPKHERDAAVQFATEFGFNQLLIDSEELEIEGFAANPVERCYYCKQELFRKLTEIAKEKGLTYVCDGSNYTDLFDIRPGMNAAKELQIRSPLQEAGLTKDEIRELSRELGLPTWDKPSFACLSSRIPFGERITIEKLKQVDAAEQFIRSFGIKQVRVRHHSEIARIEIDPADFPKLLADGNSQKVAEKLKSLGFTFVTLDLQGYRTGSMHESKLNSNIEIRNSKQSSKKSN